MIRVEDVTMRFRMNSDRILSLKEFVTTALRGKLRYEEFTALSHVSFEVGPRGTARRNTGSDWPERGREEHHAENNLRHFEAYRGPCGDLRECGAHAGAGQRI